MTKAMQRKLNRLAHICQKDTIKIGNDGKITNWKQLSPLAKESYLEDTYENIDYSHSSYRYPACRLLQELGWKYLEGLDEVASKVHK